MFGLKQYIRTLSLFIILISLPPVNSTLAATWNVPADFDSVGTAIEAALDGDTILIAPGSYPCPFSITKDLTIRGNSLEPGTVILEVSSFNVGAATMVSLEGVTFSGENSPDLGLMTGTVRISDCHFENFQMQNCWGITILYGDVEFRRCLVRNNNNYASMFWVSNGGQAAFHECEFLNNSGMTGSAITLFGNCSPLLVDECLFRQNHATGRGGALQGDTLMKIENSRFEENTAGSQGGAIAGDDCRIVNCSFIGNSASQGGALAMARQCNVYLENTDFGENTATDAGPQGFTTLGVGVNMICCVVDLELWAGAGQVTLDNDGCTVGTQQTSLGSIKAMFR